MLSGPFTFIDEVLAIESIPEIQFNNNSRKQKADISGQFALSVSEGNSIKVSVKNEIEQEFKIVFNEHYSYTLKNNSPILLGFNIIEKVGAKAKYPSSGQTVNLSAVVVDPDNDDLDFQWTVRGLEESNYSGNNISISLPKGAGTVTAKVTVKDNRGCIVQGRHKIGYGQKEELFSGKFLDNDNNPIEGVEVKVNDAKSRTDSNGHFILSVPISETYSLFAKKREFTSYGRVFQKSQAGKEYLLGRTTSHSLNSSQRIELNSNGARLEVPENSLVDRNGNRPETSIKGEFTLLNISENQFPGDFVGRDGDEIMGLISYGMVEVNFYDGKKEYNLKKGTKAKITIPIAGRENKNILKDTPRSIPIWTYNENSGEWDKSGIARLDESNLTYVGTIEHFSTINIDQPNASTCIRVLTDPALMSNYLRVSDVSGDGIDYATVKEVQIDDALSAIYRIPPNQKVKIDILDGPNGNIVNDVIIDVFRNAQSQNGWVSNNNNEILSGPTESNLFPTYPYQECPITIHLKHQPNGNPINSPADYSKFLAYKGIVNSADAANYYALVDVGNQRLTLNDWLTHNGYTVNNSSPVVYGDNSDVANYFNTAFLNYNDLGSGRDMHFLRRPDGTASSYVANYGNFDQNHANADKALNRIFVPGSDVIATVCMEWSPLENSINQWIDNSTGSPVAYNKESGPGYSAGYVSRVEATSVVKFFVYVQNALGQAPPRVESANLDGYQDKFVPNLCMNCHGGTTADPFLDVHFRELDYKSYKFSGGREYTLLSNQELNAFESQNEIVKKSSASKISSSAIKELIDIWYNDGDNLQQVAITDNWKKSNLSPPLVFDVQEFPERLYTNVVGKSCRTCHIAFDNGSTQFDLGFDRYEEFKSRKGAISSYLTNSGFYMMPHAAITHRNFWTNSDSELDQNGDVLSGSTINHAIYLRQYDGLDWGPPIQ